MTPLAKFAAAFVIVLWTALGILAMVEAREEGTFLLLPLLVLLPILLVVGWLAVNFGSRFVPSWRGGRGRRQKLGVAALVAVVIGAGLWLGVEATIPRRAPAPDVIAAVAPACAGSAIPGAGSFEKASTNHVVVLDAEGGPSSWTGAPPMAWKPASLADTELVACISEETSVRIETCEYVGASPIVRYRAERQVQIVDAGSGTVVASFAVGDNPRDCQQSESRDVTALHGDLKWSQVRSRLSPVVEYGQVPEVTPRPSLPNETPAVPVEPVVLPEPVIPEETPAAVP